MSSKSGRPVRVLQVVGGMNRAGVETWLMHVLRHIDRKRFHMDFLVHTERPCAYDEEIRDMGSKIIPCIRPSQPWRYVINFRRILEQYGPYDVIHSHVHHFSGFVVYLARRFGIPGRVTHSHSDTSVIDMGAGTLRKCYLRMMKYLILKNATIGLACSRKAAAALYGRDWQSDKRWQVLYCGIDLKPFLQPIERGEVRRELGIPDEAFVIGCVGRFHEQKNHRFLIEIASEVANQMPKTFLVLIGDGPLRPAIESEVALFKLTDKVIFTGLRRDVPRLMRGAMDVFVMPSLHEGLPLVAIEAQAAGLPTILSDIVTNEVDIAEFLMRRLSISQSASEWADAILEIGKGLTMRERANAVDIIGELPFNIKNGIKDITLIYEEQAL